jgi:deoxyribose-phosphate aldolase
VAPLPGLLGGRWAAVFEDLRAVVAASAAPVKVILETGLLGHDQAVAGAAVARAAGAASLKTSTGFGRGGATVEAVALLRAVAGDRLGVKASGGIRTTAQALAMIEAGASRLGASASVAILAGWDG